MFKIPRDKCSSAFEKSSNPTKIAFTLAEVMIVLAIIGILSAILLPSAIHSTPDKNILKFKKAHNTLFSAVREMVNSDKYYKDGSLAKPNTDALNCIPYKPNAMSGYSDIGCVNYFCNVLGDIVSAKEITCAVSSLNSSCYINDIGISFYNVKKYWMDQNCDDSSFSFDNKILTSDDVLFYDYGTEFGSFNLLDTDCQGGSATARVDSNGTCIRTDKNGFDLSSVLYCIDIDGDGPIKPFGYGIRTDGKIVSGARADWWLSRDITKKETDCCPADLNTNGLCDEGDIVCE